MTQLGGVSSGWGLLRMPMTDTDRLITTLQQARIRGHRAVNLTDRARVVLAGLDISLQQQDHNSLRQVAGGASLSHRGSVIESFHVVLGQMHIVKLRVCPCGF